MAISGSRGGASSRAGGSDYRPMAEINVTPLVDVMLVLLIIFMVAAPLLIQGVPVQLPKTSAAKLTDQQKKTIVVTLAPDGVVNIGNDAVTVGELSQRLRALRDREGNDKIVYVRADRSVPYGDVMQLLGRVGEAGFSRVQLLAQAAPETAIKAN